MAWSATFRLPIKMRPWNGANSRGREAGAYYDRSWRAAIESGAARVAVTSFNEWHEGTQIEPAAAAFTPDRPGERAESYYPVQVRTRGSTPTGSSTALSIMPGMVASVDIHTGRKTVLHYLLKPIVKVRDGMLRER